MTESKSLSLALQWQNYYFQGCVGKISDLTYKS